MNEGQERKKSWKPGNLLNPVPVVMVSCQGTEKNARPNILTVAWTGTVCTNPPMVSISVRPERYSYHLIRESGEFVINLVTEELGKVCDWCGVRSGRDEDKFQRCHLHPFYSEFSSVPAIQESPVNLYAKVTKRIPLGSHDLFLARITGVTVDASLIDRKGKLCLDRAGLITFLHGEYFNLGEKKGSFGFSVRKNAGNGRKHQRKVSHG